MKMNICLLYYDVERVPVCTTPLTYSEILKKNKKALDKRTYSLVRTLESLPKFSDLIKKIRVESLVIPEKSFGWEALQKLSNENNIERELDSLRYYGNWVKDMNPTDIKGLVHTNIPGLDALYSNVELGVRKIYEEFFLPDSIKEQLKLIILYESMLIPFSGLMDTYYVSDRDLRIVELKDVRRLQHNQIADLLAEESNDYSINEDQIKNAYNVAVDKIALLQKGNTNT